MLSAHRDDGAVSRASSNSDESDAIVHTPPATPPTPSPSTSPHPTSSPARQIGNPLSERYLLGSTSQTLHQVTSNSSTDSDDVLEMSPFRNTGTPANALRNRRSSLRSRRINLPTLSSESTYDEAQQAADNVAPSTKHASDPISAKDWEAQRPNFVKHYIDEGRTLKDVRAIMERQYNFKATERMYKKRIAGWHLRKYTTRRQQKNSFSDSSKSGPGQRSPDNEPSTSQNPVLVADDQVEELALQPATLTKRRCAIRRDLDSYLKSTDANLTYDRFMALSKDLNNVEIILTQVYNYYDSYTDTDWTRVFPKTARSSIKELPLCSDMQLVSKTAATPMVRHPGELFNRIHMAIELLAIKSPNANQLAWKMLGDAFGMVKDVLVQQHPQLLRYFFMQFWDHTLDEHPEIRRSLFSNFYEFAKLSLGPSHPITLIAKLLPNMEHTSHVCEVSWRRQLNTFETILGEGSDESLRLKMALTGNYVVAGQYDEADSVLRQIVAIFEPDSTAYYHRAARCRIAWIHSLRFNYAEAEREFVKVLRLCQAQSGRPTDRILVDDIYLASMTHLARIRSRKDYQQGKNLLTEALELCTIRFGADHAYTFTMANELKVLGDMSKSASS